MDYGDILFPVLASNQSKRLEYIQRQAALVCTKAYQRTPHVLLLKEVGWEELHVRRKYHCLVVMFKIQNGLVPTYLSNICPLGRLDLANYNLRNNANIRPFYCRYTSFRKSFFPETVSNWNTLDRNIKESQTTNIFKKGLSNILQNQTCKLYSMFSAEPP